MRTEERQEIAYQRIDNVGWHFPFDVAQALAGTFIPRALCRRRGQRERSLIHKFAFGVLTERKFYKHGGGSAPSWRNVGLIPNGGKLPSIGLAWETA